MPKPKVESKGVIRETLTEVAEEVAEVRKEVKEERREFIEETADEIKDELSEDKPKVQEVKLDELETHLHHVGGKPLKMNTAQHKKFHELEEKVERVLGGRSQGDLTHADPFWAAKEELDKFISTLES